MKRCGNVSSGGDACQLKARHTGRHQALRPDGWFASWQWSRHQACHIVVTDVSKIEAIRAALGEAREPIRHAAHFMRQFDRMPLKKMADAFYGIHSGTEYEAELKLSVLRKAVKADDMLNNL